MVTLNIHSTIVCLFSLLPCWKHRLPSSRPPGHPGQGVKMLRRSIVFQWPFLWLSIRLIAVNLWQFFPMFVGILEMGQTLRILYFVIFAPNPRCLWGND